MDDATGKTGSRSSIREAAENVALRTPEERRELARDYHLQSQIGFRLRVASQIAVERFTELFALDPETAKITTSQFAVLAVLWDASDLSHKEVAQRTSMDMPTLNGLLKRLLARGLVTVNVAEKDKRYRVINLTEAGRALAEHLRARGHIVSQQVLEPLPEADRELLLNLLSRLVQGHRG
ncbi:MarR family winged helix-turn-helix transcriptional regulator [Pararhodobacter oceanensis]|uniref:MarR family transcriptional regulator n=1 Tax=Pararhodobacter oceanensis TaxID=2172121 RepID=A0A2T8HXJ9_9RHOB|nr:MarR family transcriptional regulator [Pararhodobacter oceanensis]PVH30159.1 MarR family transcriptional regulator [Pararhodobacter oceanensis]